MLELTPFWFGLYKLAKYATYPYTWLVALLGLLTVLISRRVSPARLRWLRILSVSTLLLAYLLGTPIIARTLLGSIEAQYPPFDPTALKRFDAIVVLSGGALGKGSLRPSDQLTETSMERTLCGADLFARGLGHRLLLTGGDASIFGEGPQEAVEMKRLALKLGVPEPAILLETRSRTTYENAVETKRLLGNASILLVTSASHIPRAVALFRKQGLDVTPAPCGYLVRNRPDDLLTLTPFDFLPGLHALQLTTIAITEWAGTILYQITGKL